MLVIMSDMVSFGISYIFCLASPCIIWGMYLTGGTLPKDSKFFELPFFKS